MLKIMMMVFLHTRRKCHWIVPFPLLEPLEGEWEKLPSINAGKWWMRDASSNRDSTKHSHTIIREELIWTLLIQFHSLYCRNIYDEIMYTIRQKSGGVGKSSPPLRFLSTLEISLNPWDFSQPLRFLSALEISVNPWDFSQPLRFLSTISQYLPHFGGERIQLQWWWKYVKVGNNSAEFFQPSETASNHFPSISLCKGSEVALLVEYLKSLPDENFTAGNLHFNAFDLEKLSQL